MKLILLICCFILQNSCNGQKKEHLNDTTKMAQEIETFNINFFKENVEEGRVVYSFLNEKKDFITQTESKDYYTEKIEKFNSKYSISKVFFKTGHLKGKGQLYDNIFIGEYTWYDNEGKKVRVDDFDKNFSFTLEDVLNYLEENDIKEVEKSPTGHKIKVHLWRTDSSKLTKDDPIVWEISYGLVPHIPKDQMSPVMCHIKITLDGKTGKEIKKEYKRAKVDNEWSLVE